MSRIFEITEKVAAYYPKADLDLINRAYVYSAQVHADQKRRSGEPYLNHPLAVADILASLKLDEASIVTGLLHDTVEDTCATLDDIQERFGSNVAELVDGVTKIGQIPFTSSEHKQVENYRKMLLATAKDLRVLLVKLADRLHTMRTLEHMPARKRLAIATETMEIYSPLAHRLGIHWIKQELEDLAFAHVHVTDYKKISEHMASHVHKLDKTRERLETLLQEALDRQGLEAKVQGRMKHLYSLYEKMQRKHVDFDEVYDLVAFRVLVHDTPACYQALGLIHSMYRPVPGRFKDYIALPKPNGYQSLHTTVIGPDNYRIEVQIRTESMHRMADYGVAAHWLYKGGVAGQDQEQLRWLSQLTELLQESENPGEFLENVRLDLFVQEVYVLTRDGDVISLPRGALPLDFAYAIHTNVGNHCIGVRINGQSADFLTQLQNGDQIEVLTNPEQTPSRQWLQYVRTPKARQAIRQWFRRQEREASIQLGEHIFRDIMGKDAVITAGLLKTFETNTDKEFMEKLGHGMIPMDELLKAVDRKEGKPLSVKGLPHTVIQTANCCIPLPGDPVLGRFEQGIGMRIHHRDCERVGNDKKASWMEVRWKGEEGKLYSTAIEIKTENRRGMLAGVTGVIAESAANIEDLKIRQLGGSMTTLHILLQLADRTHLARVMRSVHALEGVVKVSRNIQASASHKSAKLERRSTKGFAETIRKMVSKGLRR
ncbi:MAG: bifunctional (p)ppGpp synthetase/guanosine-3',5'-bis(diphosphate) 3'-pyrophosphohydrolase [Mariprofundaceae bacterium]